MVFFQRRGCDGVVGVMFGCSVFDHTRSKLLAAEDVQAEVHQLCCCCVLMGQMRLAGFEEGGRREKGPVAGIKIRVCAVLPPLYQASTADLGVCMPIQKQPRRPRSATTPFSQHRDLAA